MYYLIYKGGLLKSNESGATFQESHSPKSNVSVKERIFDWLSGTFGKVQEMFIIAFGNFYRRIHGIEGNNETGGPNGLRVDVDSPDPCNTETEKNESD